MPTHRTKCLSPSDDCLRLCWNRTEKVYQLVGCRSRSTESARMPNFRIAEKDGLCTNSPESVSSLVPEVIEHKGLELVKVAPSSFIGSG